MGRFPKIGDRSLPEPPDHSPRFPDHPAGCPRPAGRRGRCCGAPWHLARVSRALQGSPSSRGQPEELPPWIGISMKINENIRILEDFFVIFWNFMIFMKKSAQILSQLLQNHPWHACAFGNDSLTPRVLPTRASSGGGWCGGVCPKLHFHKKS